MEGGGQIVVEIGILKRALLLGLFIKVYFSRKFYFRDSSEEFNSYFCKQESKERAEWQRTISLAKVR